MTPPEQQRLKDEFQAVLDGPIAVNLPIDTASPTRTPDTGGVTRRDVDPAVAALQALQGQQTGGAGVPDAGGHQAEKRGFLAQAEQKDKTFYVSGRLEDPVSPYELKSGAVIPCTMITGINSDLPGSLTCQVRQNVYDTVTGNYLLVPQGTKAVGEYDSAIVYGQERVLAVWHRLILPNGQSIDLEGMEGVDLSGYAGYTDRVDNHWKRLIGAVVLSSVFAAAPTATVGNGNSSDFNRPVGDEVARNIGANIQRAGDQIVSKNLNIQPTLMVGPGYAVNIFVKKDLVLAPYTVYRGSDIAFGRTANEPRRTLP
jgi:type IV secretion system protein VirB10